MFSKNIFFKRFFLISTILFIFGALLYLILIPRPVKVESAEVTQGSFRQTIQIDGILRSKQRYTVSAFADGDIQRIPFTVGDSLRKNQTITILTWDLKNYPVKAPITGVISKIYRESPGSVRRGDPIVEFIDPLQLEVMAEPLTTDATRLELGAPITVTNWTGGTPFNGKIVRISKAGFTKHSALGVEEERTEVTGDLIGLPMNMLAKMGSNFHVDVVFQISETPNALKIPLGALFRDGQNWCVFKIEENQARKKIVLIAATNVSEASIEKGLTVGDRVIVFPGDLVKDGIRVKTD